MFNRKIQLSMVIFNSYVKLPEGNWQDVGEDEETWISDSVLSSTLGKAKWVYNWFIYIMEITIILTLGCNIL